MPFERAEDVWKLDVDAMPTEIAEDVLHLDVDLLPTEMAVNMLDLDEVHRMRRKAVEEKCSKLSPLKRGAPSLTDHQYYDPDSNGLFCFVPKVGCSTWKKIFSILLSKEPQDPVSISGLEIHKKKSLESHLLSMRPKSYRDRVSQDAFSFMFSRDPFQRVFSGYCDKLFMLSRETKDLTNLVRRYMSQHASKRNRIQDLSALLLRPVTEVPKGPELNLTFAELLEHVAQIEDPHFLPISSQCNPCSTSFDILGRMETFDQDTEYILDKLNSSHLIKSSLHTSQYKLSRDLGVITELVDRTFSYMSTERGAKYKALVRMWKTFHVRGLVSDAIGFPLKASEVWSIGREDMASLATRALKDSGNATVREAQRDKYYRQAYRSVPLETLRRFSQFAQKDCTLFGYDCKPPDIFRDRVEGDEEENIFSSDRLLYEGTELVS